MGSSSMSTHRGLMHWQGLLLVVSLFNFWSQSTTAQVTVESTEALEGTNVTLRIRDNVPNAASFMWYRGDIVDINNNIAYLTINSGSYVRGSPGGQGIVEDDGSLLLKNVTMKDSGTYTVLIILQGCQQMISCGWLDVHRVIDVPTLRASKTTVRENKDAVVLTCNANYGAIKWLFNGMSLNLTDRMQLSLDHRNLTLDPVLSSDDGYYQCKAYNPLNSGKSAPLKLGVTFE